MDGMNDILLQKFFEIERWEKALETGVDKHIDKGIVFSYALAAPISPKMAQNIIIPLILKLRQNI